VSLAPDVAAGNAHGLEVREECFDGLTLGFIGKERATQIFLSLALLQKQVIAPRTTNGNLTASRAPDAFLRAAVGLLLRHAGVA